MKNYLFAVILLFMFSSCGEQVLFTYELKPISANQNMEATMAELTERLGRRGFTNAVVKEHKGLISVEIPFPERGEKELDVIARVFDGADLDLRMAGDIRDPEYESIIKNLESVRGLQTTFGTREHPTTWMGYTNVDIEDHDMVEDLKKVNAACPDCFFVWSDKKDIYLNESYYVLYLVKGKREERGRVHNGQVSSTSVVPSQIHDSHEVNVRLNSEGARTFAQMTTTAFNRGNKPIAILKDGRALSVPIVRGPITGGSFIISQDYNFEEAQELANEFEFGKMKNPVELVSKQVVKLE